MRKRAAERQQKKLHSVLISENALSDSGSVALTPISAYTFSHEGSNNASARESM